MWRINGEGFVFLPRALTKADMANPSAPISPVSPLSAEWESLRPLTAADVAVLPNELPSGPVLYELQNGRLITMAPPGNVHGAVESNLVLALKTQGEAKGYGKVRSGDVGILLWRNPDRLVGADVLFVAADSLPIHCSPEGYLLTIPDLVVEVRSKNDSQPRLQQKVNDYLSAGVRVVWVADPGTRSVTEYRLDSPPQVFAEAQTLTIPDVIPDLSLPVQSVFAE